MLSVFWSPNVKQHRLGKWAVRSSVLTSRLFWLWEPKISLGHLSAVCASGVAMGLGWWSDQAVKGSKDPWLGLQVLLFCRSLCWVAVRCEWVCGAHNNFRAESVNDVCRGSSLAALGPCSCCTGSSHHAVSSTEAQVAASPRPPGKSQAGAASGTLLFWA